MDFGTLTEVFVDAENRIVAARQLRVGPGARLTDVLDAALAERYAVPPQTGERVDRKA